MISISMLTGPNGLLNKAVEAKIEYGHAEVKEVLELEEVVYHMKKSDREYSGDLLDYLKEKGYMNEEGKVNISILLNGNEIATGKEKVPGKDFYKIVEQTAETESVKQVMII